MARRKGERVEVMVASLTGKILPMKASKAHGIVDIPGLGGFPVRPGMTAILKKGRAFMPYILPVDGALRKRRRPCLLVREMDATALSIPVGIDDGYQGERVNDQLRRELRDAVYIDAQADVTRGNDMAAATQLLSYVAAGVVALGATLWTVSAFI